MGAEICFDIYLRSLVSKYERSQDGYAQTDAADLFDFGLTVQEVKEKKERQEGQESQDSEQEKSKIERFPVLDGIRKYAADHVLLVGRPGSGKSTALQKLLVDETQKVLDGQASLIPVLIELRSWRISYITLIKDFFRGNKLKLDEETIDDLLFEGKLLLLVDGVNELPADDLARQNILTLRETNVDTSMIFTTRVLGVGGDLGIEKKLEMLPLTELQMRQFVQMRLPEQGNQMLQQLGDRLRKSGDTPLLLSMLCDVFRINGRVPANLGAAFRDFANLYDGKLKEHIPVSEHSRSWWSKLLPQLAFAMMPQGRPDGLRLSMPRSEAVDVLTQFLDREKFDKPRDYAQRWLKDLLDYHLIQVKLVGTNQEIEFRHQLIQEYYAAEYLLPLFPNLKDDKFQHSYLNYLDWTESLALMLEFREIDEEQAVRVVKLALEMDLRLGARLAGAVKYGFQEKTVGLLIREIDERKIPQLYAIELLGNMRSEFAIKPIIFSLRNQQDDSIRWRSAKALGEIGSNKAVESLIQMLKDENDFIRGAAAEGLGKISNDKAVQPLIQNLRHGESHVRYETIKALGKIGSDQAIESLVKMLKDESEFIRETAAEALGEIGSKKSFSPLIQTLNDKHESVRQMAAKSLRKIDSDKAIQLLVQIIKDKYNGVLFESFNKECIGFAFGEYYWATMALGNIGTDKAVEPLISILKTEELGVSLIAGEALEKIGNNKVLQLLIQTLKDLTPNVRCNVIEILGRIGSEKAVELLIESLKDNSIPVRYNAARALGKIGSKKATEALIQTLKDDLSHDVRGIAAQALGEIGSDNAVDHLIRSLKNDRILVRCCAARALGNIGSNIAVEVLIQSLQGEDYEVRREAAKALGKIGDLKAQESLIQALQGEDYEVRSNSIESLGGIGSQKAVESLMQILNDENDSIRAKAIEALGKIGGDRAVTFLLQILENQKSGLRSNAALALGSTRSDKVVEFLFKSLKKYEEDDGVGENIEFSLSVVDALENIASKKAIYYLLTIFEESDFVVYPEIVINAIENTADRNLPELIQQLPRIANIVFTDASQEALNFLSAIQSRCKYYNYDIAQMTLPSEDKANLTTRDTYIFNGKVEQVLVNPEIKGNNIATQNNPKSLPET